MADAAEPLGTDTSPQHDYQGFRGRVRVGPIDPRGGSAEPVAGPPTDRGCKAVIQGAATPGESGGATRATLLPMRAHRETGSSNPLPSSSESPADLGRTRTKLLSRASPRSSAR